MPDTSATLKALINARRPYKKFTIEGEEGELTLYARRPGSGEQNEINNLFNAAYQAKREEIESEESEMALFKRGLSKQSLEDILDYVLDSDTADFEYDAMKMLDKPSREEIEAKAKELKEARRAELKVSHTKADLVKEALERRSHVISYTAATEAILRHVVVFTVYDENKERLFVTVEDLDEVPEAVIAELSTKAAEALRDPKEERKHDPLEPAASTPSVELSPSPDIQEVAT